MTSIGPPNSRPIGELVESYQKYEAEAHEEDEAAINDFLEECARNIGRRENGIQLRERMNVLSRFVRVIHYYKHFMISTLDVAVWLQVDPESVYRHLIRNPHLFTPGIDWTSEPEMVQACNMGRPRYIYRMSTKAFKKYCIRSQSPIAKYVLEYFVYVEDKYREFMLRENRDRRRMEKHQLERMSPEERKLVEEEKQTQYIKEIQKSPLNALNNIQDNEEYVYVIAIMLKGRPDIVYKIGRTENLDERMDDVKRSLKRELQTWIGIVYAVALPSHMIEGCVHNKLKEHNVECETSIEIFDGRLGDIINALEECRQEYIHGQYCTSDKTQKCSINSCAPLQRRPSLGVLPEKTWGNKPDAVADHRRKLKK